MNSLVKVHPAVVAARSRFHADVVQEVAAAVARDAVVVVGMSQNPHPARAVRLLKERGIPHTYLAYGSYFSKWRERLALKMWAGWPTFPQVYVHGMLIGGASDLKKLDESGELKRLLDAGRA